MTERADQLVLDYVNRAADAAHRVLRPRQRIDFVAVLRRRIDAECAGTEDPEVVAEVLARFGDPVALVHRELRRLEGRAPSRAGRVIAPVMPLAAPTPDDPVASAGSASGDPAVPAPRRPVRGHPYASTAPPSGAEPAESTEPAGSSGGPGSVGAPGDNGGQGSDGGPEPTGDASEGGWEDEVDGDPPTEEIPAIREPLSSPEARGGPSREVAPEAGEGAAPENGPEGKPVSSDPGREPPPGVARGIREAEERLARRKGQGGWLRRRLPARSRESVAPGTRDTRTILLNHRRETIGMALLALSGLLIPFPFAPIAIFRIPVLVWAVAVLVVIACETWHTSDKVLGTAAPIVSYTLGGGLVALVRARDDLGTVVEEFFTISGLMFLLGAAWGVFWLAYRLLSPTITPGRGIR